MPLAAEASVFRMPDIDETDPQEQVIDRLEGTFKNTLCFQNNSLHVDL